MSQKSRKTQSSKKTIQQNSKRTREPKTAYSQYEVMLAYMEQHKDFAHGLLVGVQGRRTQENMWIELATILNGDPLGPKKSVERWTKVWRDWKCSVRKKKAQQIAHLNGTGRGGPFRVAFSAAEEQLLEFLTPIAVAGETSRVLGDGFLELPSQPIVQYHCDDSETDLLGHMPTKIDTEDDGDTDGSVVPVEATAQTKKRKRGPTPQSKESNNRVKMNTDDVRASFEELQNGNAAANTHIGNALHRLAAVEERRVELDEQHVAAINSLTSALNNVHALLATLANREML